MYSIPKIVFNTLMQKNSKNVWESDISQNTSRDFPVDNCSLHTFFLISFQKCTKINVRNGIDFPYDYSYCIGT